MSTTTKFTQTIEGAVQRVVFVFALPSLHFLALASPCLTVIRYRLYLASSRLSSSLLSLPRVLGDVTPDAQSVVEKPGKRETGHRKHSEPRASVNRETGLKSFVLRTSQLLCCRPGKRAGGEFVLWLLNFFLFLVADVCTFHFAASNLFRLMSHYLPETVAQKKARLLETAKVHFI